MVPASMLLNLERYRLLRPVLFGLGVVLLIGLPWLLAYRAENRDYALVISTGQPGGIYNPLAEAIADESEQQQAANDTELASSYIGMMTETIQNNWSRPPSARNNMEAELMIQLVPTGQVVSVDIIKSSGNDAFDRSAVKAVEKADRFPELQNLPNRVFEKNFRRLRIKFRPEDLRL